MVGPGPGGGIAIHLRVADDGAPRGGVGRVAIVPADRGIDRRANGTKIRTHHHHIFVATGGHVGGGVDDVTGHDGAPVFDLRLEILARFHRAAVAGAVGGVRCVVPFSVFGCLHLSIALVVYTGVLGNFVPECDDGTSLSRIDWTTAQGMLLRVG